MIRGFRPSGKILPRSDKGFRTFVSAHAGLHAPKMFTRLFLGSWDHLPPRRPHEFWRSSALPLASFRAWWVGVILAYRNGASSVRAASYYENRWKVVNLLVNGCSFDERLDPKCKIILGCFSSSTCSRSIARFDFVSLEYPVWHCRPVQMRFFSFNPAARNDCCWCLRELCFLLFHWFFIELTAMLQSTVG